MSNRNTINERSKVSYTVDPLVALFDSCRRNGRPAKFPIKFEKIYFDTDRFRWLFTKIRSKGDLWDSFEEMTIGNPSLQQWRDWIDEQMRKEERDGTPT